MGQLVEALWLTHEDRNLWRFELCIDSEEGGKLENEERGGEREKEEERGIYIERGRERERNSILNKDVKSREQGVV